MIAKLVALPLAIGLVCLASQVYLAAPSNEREQCLEAAAAYLSRVPLDPSHPYDVNDDGPWRALLEKSRQFYPNFEDLLLTTSPKAGYVEAMLAIGNELSMIGEGCRELINLVDKMATEVPCFSAQESESPLEDLSKIMKKSRGIQRLTERYLICHYATDRF